MDYHADRFADHSLLYYIGGKLVALLPANEVDDELHSHQGLTYGGLVLDRVGTAAVLDLLSATRDYLREHALRALYYKPVPTIYHRLPAQDAEYALWRLGAECVSCSIASTVDLQSADYQMRIDHQRRTGANKASRLDYEVQEVALNAELWAIVEENLRERYNVKPVHTLDELQRLATAFPENIRCFAAVKRGCPGTKGVENYSAQAVAVLYVTPTTVHLQYAHATAQGKHDRCLDLLYTTLLERYATTHRYFDFGTSNEDGGRLLNAALVAHKESFGAHGVAYKQYALRVITK